MNIYDELQLNAGGSKQLIRSAATPREKRRHTLLYIGKVVLTVAFCFCFVTLFSLLFGSDNSVPGVVVLLCILTFRFTDFGIRVPHAVGALAAIFAVFAFLPRLANAALPGVAFLVHLIAVFVLVLLGCHNVILFNQAVLVLGYLLLFGYDVTGASYAPSARAGGRLRPDVPRLRAQPPPPHVQARLCRPAERIQPPLRPRALAGLDGARRLGRAAARLSP